MPRESAEVLDQAIAKVREEADTEPSEWAALELICADYLGNP
jgi:hypothetical protein